MSKKHLEFSTYINRMDNSLLKRKLLLLAVVCCSTVILFSGCKSDRKASDDTITTSNQVVDNEATEDNQVSDSTSTKNDPVINSETAETNATATITPVESNPVEATSSVEENGNKEGMLLFTELSKYQYIFCSGVGAWQTILTIYEDGTFSGYYNDSDMGDIGEEYPNGTNYSCIFDGKFTTPKRVNDYTYSMTIEAISLVNEAGTEEIVEGIRYIYSEPYGLENAKEIYIYTTKAPIKELPEGFRNWAGYMGLNDVNEEYLPFYGLYNVETECGFTSFEIVEEDPGADIITEVEEIEKQYEIMNDRLANEGLSQSKMNILAKDIYILWDDEINKIWGYLKDSLDKDTMDQLTTAQREWIKRKESEVNKAGSKYEGGSIQPMIEYITAAELTRDRVYELIEYLR